MTDSTVAVKGGGGLADFSKLHDKLAKEATALSELENIAVAIQRLSEDLDRRSRALLQNQATERRSLYQLSRQLDPASSFEEYSGVIGSLSANYSSNNDYNNYNNSSGSSSSNVSKNKHPDPFTANKSIVGSNVTSGATGSKLTSSDASNGGGNLSRPVPPRGDSSLLPSPIAKVEIAKSAAVNPSASNWPSTPEIESEFVIVDKAQTDISLDIFYEPDIGYRLPVRNFTISPTMKVANVITTSLRSYSPPSDAEKHDLVEIYNGGERVMRRDEILYSIKSQWEKKGLGKSVEFVMRPKQTTMMETKLSATEVMAQFQQQSCNTFCADCDSPGPSFVSLSLGVFLCRICAQIHMSFDKIWRRPHTKKVIEEGLEGFPSRVRPIPYFAWTQHWVQSLLATGNERVNGLFEADPASFSHKPTSNSSRVERSEYIYAKYGEKKFTGLKAKIDTAGWEKNMISLINGPRLATLHLNFVLHSVPEDFAASSSMLLHVAAGYPSLDALNLLLHSGRFNPLQLDREGRTAYSHAYQNRTRQPGLQQLMKNAQLLFGTAIGSRNPRVWVPTDSSSSSSSQSSAASSASASSGNNASKPVETIMNMRDVDFDKLFGDVFNEVVRREMSRAALAANGTETEEDYDIDDAELESYNNRLSQYERVGRRRRSSTGARNKMCSLPEVDFQGLAQNVMHEMECRELMFAFQKYRDQHEHYIDNIPSTDEIQTMQSREESGQSPLVPEKSGSASSRLNLSTSLATSKPIISNTQKPSPNTAKALPAIREKPPAEAAIVTPALQKASLETELTKDLNRVLQGRFKPAAGNIDLDKQLPTMTVSQSEERMPPSSSNSETAASGKGSLASAANADGRLAGGNSIPQSLENLKSTRSDSQIQGSSGGGGNNNQNGGSSMARSESISAAIGKSSGSGSGSASASASSSAPNLASARSKNPSASSSSSSVGSGSNTALSDSSPFNLSKASSLFNVRAKEEEKKKEEEQRRRKYEEEQSEARRRYDEEQREKLRRQKEAEQQEMEEARARERALLQKMEESRRQAEMKRTEELQRSAEEQRLLRERLEREQERKRLENQIRQQEEEARQREIMEREAMMQTEKKKAELEVSTAIARIMQSVPQKPRSNDENEAVPSPSSGLALGGLRDRLGSTATISSVSSGASSQGGHAPGALSSPLASPAMSTVGQMIPPFVKEILSPNFPAVQGLMGDVVATMRELRGAIEKGGSGEIVRCTVNVVVAGMELCKFASGVFSEVQGQVPYLVSEQLEETKEQLADSLRFLVNTAKEVARQGTGEWILVRDASVDAVTNARSLMMLFSP